MELAKTQEVAGVRHVETKGPITLDRIYKADFQKDGTLTAQIRQIVTIKSYYPAKKVETSLQANIFDTKDFGFSEKEFESIETRIAWIPVPPASTEAVIKGLLAVANSKGAVIYKVLSNSPILDENQIYAINNGFKTKDDFANTQAVRYPSNEKTLADGTANTLVKDKSGFVQYRRTFYWNTPQKDIDARTSDELQTYLSAELAAELKGASVMQGQTIGG